MHDARVTFALAFCKSINLVFQCRKIAIAANNFKTCTTCAIHNADFMRNGIIKTALLKKYEKESRISLCS